jgi:hypothetical protein
MYQESRILCSPGTKESNLEFGQTWGKRSSGGSILRFCERKRQGVSAPLVRCSATRLSGLAAKHHWVLLNPRHLGKAILYIQDHQALTTIRTETINVKDRMLQVPRRPRTKTQDLGILFWARCSLEVHARFCRSVHCDPPAHVGAQAPRLFVINDSQFPLAISRFGRDFKYMSQYRSTTH